MTKRSLIAATLALCLGSLLTGCSANFGAISPSTTIATAITGQAHGGRQPIVGSQIYLLEANTTAYAGPGIAATTSNASKSLLITGDGTSSIGTYVLTQPDGSFTITGQYATCDTGSQVYLYSLGGKPDGLNANSAIGLMAVLGTCGSFGSGTTVNMNEASTVAAAYAFAAFATDATHVGAPSSTNTLAATGITNAFANANQLYDISSIPVSTGSGNPARATTPNGNGSGFQSQVNTLANILAACVNSSGPTFSQCSTLLGDVSNNGVAPTDTASAAIGIAQHSGTNVTPLYGVTGVGAPNPYTPWYSTTAPADFSVAVFFTLPNNFHFNNGGLSGTSVDASGNIWAAISSTSSALEITSLGVSVSGSPFTGSSLPSPIGIAIDSHSLVWVANGTDGPMATINPSTNPYTITATSSNDGTYDAIGGSDDVWLASQNTVWLYSNGGTLLQTFPGFQDAIQMAIDNSNRAWVIDNNKQTLSILTSAGTVAFTSSAGANGLDTSSAIAIDHSGNAWVSNYGDNSVSEFNSSGGATGISPIAVGQDLEGIAFDGDGHAWLDGVSGVLEVNSGGTLLSPATGYSKGTVRLGSIAVDGSGNIWLGSSGPPSTFTEIIGIASPVTTPLSAGVENNALATRP